MNLNCFNKKGQSPFQALPRSSRQMRLSGHIDTGVASQVGLVFALEVLVAGIDVPFFPFLIGLNIALFTII